MEQKNTKIFSMPFAKVYPLYVQKVERKWRTQAEVEEVIFWLTGYNAEAFQKHLKNQTDFATFFDEAPQMNPNASKISGTICGYKIQDIQDPLMKKIRYLDKLVDEIAKGKSMEKILRK